MKLRSHHHCVYDLHFHLVLVTKYRKKCLSKEIIGQLETICRNLCEKWDVGLEEFGAESDHIHLLLEFHPNIMPSKFINNLKTVSSRLIRRDFSAHLTKFYWKKVLWTRAYCFLSTGGVTIDVIKKYIEKQGK